VADLFISHRAEDELRGIWRYIAADNPDAADRLLLRIDAKLQMLRAFPVIGPARDEVRPGCRMLVEGSYQLLYEYDASNNAIEVVAIVDGRRDLSDSFEKKGESDQRVGTGRSPL
jgi:toxin ParE1/3/4